MPKNSKFLTGLFEKYSRKMEDNDQKKKYSSEVDELVKGKSEL